MGPTCPSALALPGRVAFNSLVTRVPWILSLALALGACSIGGRVPSPIVSPAPSATVASTASLVPSATVAISPTPVHEVPSNACGGFHLKIVNAGSGRITATINGTYSVTVAAGSSETIVEWLPPSKPLLPWTVAVSDSTGNEIGTQLFSGPVDQKLTVSGGQMNSAPYDIGEDC